jgi:general secretion pathway protein N
MKVVWLGAAALLLGIMVSALAYAVPAAWVAQYVAHATQGRVQLAHARGLWHKGNATLVLSSGTGGADAVHWSQAAQWQVNAAQWPAQWALQVTLPEIGLPLIVTVRLGLSGWAATLAPWRGAVPLSALAGLGAPFNTLALEGDAQINLSALQFASVAPARPAANPVEIRIHRLRSALAQGAVLGDYIVQGNAGGDAGTFELRTTQGILQLDGQGKCDTGGSTGGTKARLSCSFAGTARATQHDDALIGNLLGLLGKQLSPGGQNTDGKPITELRW